MLQRKKRDVEVIVEQEVSWGELCVVRKDATRWLSLAKTSVALWCELTDCGDQSVGEEHGGCQVPVRSNGGVLEDGHAVLVGRQHFDQKQFEGRGVDAALVQKLLLQVLHVLAQLVLHRPLDAGENQRSEQQVDDIKEDEARQQQPRPAYRMHVLFLVVDEHQWSCWPAGVSLSACFLFFSSMCGDFFWGAVPIELEPSSSTHPPPTVGPGGCVQLWVLKCVLVPGKSVFYTCAPLHLPDSCSYLSYTFYPVSLHFSAHWLLLLLLILLTSFYSNKVLNAGLLLVAVSFPRSTFTEVKVFMKLFPSMFITSFSYSINT